MTVTKLAITLNEPGDSESWIELAKTHAEGQDIWEFINPENVRATYPSEPAYPTPVFIRQLLAEERTPPTTNSTNSSQPPIAPSSRRVIPSSDSSADSRPSRGTRSRTARDHDDDDNGNEPQPQGPGPIPQQQAQGPTDA